MSALALVVVLALAKCQSFYVMGKVQLGELSCTWTGLVKTGTALTCVSYFKVNEVAGSPGEVLSRRCVSLLKMALRPDVWANAELKLAWFDKLLTTVENHQPNFSNICTALELLSFLLTILVSFLFIFLK